MPSPRRVFDNYRGRLADLHHETLGAALTTADYDPAATDTTVDAITGEAVGDDYLRQTFEGAWDQDAGVLSIAEADEWPEFDSTGNLITGAVVFNDADGELVAYHPFPEYEGLPGDLLQLLGGIARATDSSLFEDRLAATEGRTVAGVGAAGGDYPAEPLAEALAPFLGGPSGGGQTGYELVSVVDGVAVLDGTKAGYVVLPEEPATIDLPVPETGQRMVLLVGAPPEALAGFTIAGVPAEPFSVNTVDPAAEFFALLLVPIPDLGGGPGWSITYTPQQVATSWEATLFFGSDVALDNDWAAPFSAGIKVEQYATDKVIYLFGSLGSGTTSTLIADATGGPLEGNPFAVLVAGEASAASVPVVLASDGTTITATAIGGGVPDVVYLDGVTIIR